MRGIEAHREREIKPVGLGLGGDKFFEQDGVGQAPQRLQMLRDATPSPSSRALIILLLIKVALRFLSVCQC